MNARERGLVRWMELRRQLNESGLTRREVARLGLLAGGGALAGSGLRIPGAEAQLLPLYPDSPPTTPWVERLPLPQVLQPATLSPPPNPAAHQYWRLFPAQETYRLRVRRVRHSFHPQLPGSDIFGYEGVFPGPTIDAHYGKPYVIRVENELPPDHRGFGVPQIITHLHNFHTAPESDGGPWDWIYPGQYKDHHYTMARAGFSVPDTIPAEFRDAAGGDVRETMNTLFYHDHRPEFTAANVYRGLAGFCRIFDELDTGDETTGWRLPSGPCDIPLLIADKRFDPTTGLLFFDQFATDGFLGDKLTVNGKIQPYLEVKRRKYRFRLLNAGPARFYRLVLRSNGASHPFAQITEDGNFLERPRRNRMEIELWVAERSDIVIDFSRFRAGDRVYLANTLPMRLNGRGAIPDKFLNPDAVENQLLEFRVQDSPARDPSRIPDFFRPFPPLNLDEAVRRRTFAFERRSGMWTINGELFDPDIDHSPAFLARPRNQVSRNTAEIWEFRSSDDGWDHPIHVHMEEGFLFRQGVTDVPADRLARRDVFRLRGRSRVEIFLRFRDFPDPDFNPPRPVSLAERGRYAIHCHNTLHEDHAMMTSFTVVPTRFT